MTKFLNLEDEEITYYVYNLNSQLPKETQEEAMEILSQLNNEKVHLIIPKYGKNCWENGVKILSRMGYPRNKKALPKLAELLQDRNWPGSLDAIEVFRDIGKETSTPYIERECEKALECHDYDWLEHLEFACDSLEINENDFHNKKSYISMKKLAQN
ncbi:hypothetical protein LC087_18865 (plasmid) [Bacillus carboniphilus]|uniref:DUF5071 domain-containing protein n=1 Tax=Bacillus carboniphilus TaxID=86663 RepID=A0ABY9K3F5_9BACI|nr:hypothetical protein [Bacillus carboniphilus]WLR44446.1 hypothetical protein LC087_18865 [Bacillus carboniphilus]